MDGTEKKDQSISEAIALMSKTAFLDPILRNLRQSIVDWREFKQSPGSEAVGEERTFTDKVKIIACLLDVSEKTILNWLGNPNHHPIPLKRLLEMSLHLGINPCSLLPGFSPIQFYERISDPVAAERALCDIEGRIPPGSIKMAVFPLWSSPLFLEPLNRRYVTKGLFKRFFLDDEDESEGEGDEKIKKRMRFGEEERMKEYLGLREQRRSIYESGNYILRVIFMRDEFEKYINRNRLFRCCKFEEIIEQIQYVTKCLMTKTWDNTPRLEMRLTKSYLRMQYAIFETGDLDIVIINTNSGYIKVERPPAQNLLRHEFAVFWEEGTYEGLRTSEEWKRFFEVVLERIRSNQERKRKGLDPEYISVKEIIDLNVNEAKRGNAKRP